MDLPTECRIKILKLLLIRPYPIVLGRQTRLWISREIGIYDGQLSRIERNSLAVLRICRQIYFEGASVFYDQNSFVVWSVQTLNEFARRLSTSARSYVRKLILMRNMYGYVGWDWEKALILRYKLFEIVKVEAAMSRSLKQFPGLSRLTFYLEKTKKPDPPTLYRSFFRLGWAIPTLESVEIVRAENLHYWRDSGRPWTPDGWKQQRFDEDDAASDDMNALLLVRRQEDWPPPRRNSSPW